MTDSVFGNNTGVKEGGAIYYNYNPPTESNILFTNNLAPYGPNYASYPIRIGVLNGTIIEELVINDVGSGITLENPLKFALFDYNGQIMILDSSSKLKISFSTTHKGSISGIDQAIVQEGISTFNDFSSVVEPGANSIRYKVSSNILDNNKLMDVFNKTDLTQKIVMNFRYCKPGEQIFQNKCVTCDANTYSLDWNSTKCEKCMDKSN